MTRFCGSKSFAVSLTLLLAGFAAAAPLPEDKSALAQIPASAPLVVYVHGVEGSVNRLLVYAKNALPELAPFAEAAIKKMLEDGVDGRKFNGLAKDGPIFIAFSEIPKDAEPKFAVIVAVTDYRAFRDGLLKDDERKALKASRQGYEETIADEKPVYFVERKGYAVVTPDQKTAVAFTKMPPGLDTKISKAQANQLLKGDLGIYLSMDVVNKDYAEQIKTAKEGLEDALKNAEEGPGKSERSLIDAARNLMVPLFQAIEDSKGALLTVEFRPTALVLHVQSEQRPNTKTAAALKGYKQFALAEFDKLPTGLVTYSGMTTNADMLKLLGPLSIGAVADPDSKSGKAAKAAIEQMIKAGPGTRIDLSGLPLTGIQTWQFAEPAKARAAMAHLLDSLSKGDTFAGGMLSEKAAVKKASAKYKDISFDSLPLVWDLEKMAEASGGALGDDAQKKMAEGFKVLLGDKTTVWIGVDDKQLITVTAADWKSASALLDKRFNGGFEHQRGGGDTVGQKKGFQEARKELPSGGATVIGLVDIVAYGTAIAQFAKPLLGGLGVNFPDKYPAPLPKGDPSFIGSAITLDQTHIAFDMVITASAVHDVYKAFVVPFRGGF